MIRHRAVVDAVRDAIFLADIETGMIVDANPAAEALCGRSLAELRSLHHTQLHSPDEAERARSLFEQRTRVPGLTEGHVLHKDGHRIPVEISASHFTTSDGRRMLVGVFRDTTERNEAREAVRRSEERFRQVAESAGEFIWEVDANGLYLYASPVVKQILGYTPDEVVGRMHFYDLFAPETREETKTAAFEVFARREEFRAFPNLNVTKDGRVVALETSGLPILDGNGNLLGYRGANTDITERRQAEEALRESEERHRTILQAAMDGFWVADMQGRLLEVNESYCRMSGYSAEELLAMRISDLEANETASETADHIQRLLAQGEHRFESQHRRKDGSVLDVDISAQYQPTDGGRIVTFLRDITERKRAGGILAASEERFRALAESSLVGIYVLQDGKYAYVNPAMAGVFGYSVAEMTGMTPHDIVHPSHHAMVDENIRRRITGEVHSMHYQVRGRYRDGSIRDVEVYRSTVQLNGRPALVGTLVDITERKRAEETLRESAERFALILEATSGGVWDWNIPSGDAVFSPRYSTMLGYEPEEFAKSYKSWGSLVHPDDIERVRQHHADHFAGHTDFSIEFRMREKSGNWHWIHSRGLVIEWDAEGRPVRMVGTHSDIQERKRAEEERNSLQLQLAQAQKMESIGRLAGGIAHDFNNLMSVILLHGESALEELRSGDPVTGVVTAMQQAARRAVALTRQLMAFSHQQVLETEVLNLNSVVAECEKMLRRLIGEDIDLVFIPGSGLGMVKADPGQLDQIIMNLAVNSRDAMPQGGKLTIETANVELDEGDASLNAEAKPGSYVMLAVRDTGVGMDKEVQDRVFEPFFTTKEVGKGTGLGLSIVYGIVKQSNGYVTLHSEPGHGTEFRIYLPSVLETPEPLLATEAAPGQRGVETILLAEDEPALRDKICELLEGAGYQVLVGKDVDEVVQIAKHHKGPLDLLLTDVVMPNLSGPLLAQHLQPLHPQTKVLYMSGYPDPRKLNSVLASEADFIQKPFTKQKLLRRLREVLEGRKLSS